MTTLSPAKMMTTAAQALCDAANAALYEMKTGAYWQGLEPETAWERGITNAVGGPAGDFCALMGPDAALALARWLEVTAGRLDVGIDYCGTHGEDHPCWCIEEPYLLARQLLGEAS